MDPNENPLQHTSAHDWNVRIELFARPDGHMYLRVSLRSEVKKAMISRSIVNLGSGTKEDRKQVHAAVVSMADHQHDQYGDDHSIYDLLKMTDEGLQQTETGYNQMQEKLLDAVKASDRWDKPLLTAYVTE